MSLGVFEGRNAGEVDYHIDAQVATVIVELLSFPPACSFFTFTFFSESFALSRSLFPDDWYRFLTLVVGASDWGVEQRQQTAKWGDRWLSRLVATSPAVTLALKGRNRTASAGFPLCT